MEQRRALARLLARARFLAGTHRRLPHRGRGRTRQVASLGSADRNIRDPVPIAAHSVRLGVPVILHKTETRGDGFATTIGCDGSDDAAVAIAVVLGIDPCHRITATYSACATDSAVDKPTSARFRRLAQSKTGQTRCEGLVGDIHVPNSAGDDIDDPVSVYHLEDQWWNQAQDAAVPPTALN